ncbi:MAG TPA: hypothetical protein VM659_28460, partial [Dongiaceae bacterium]|nr:hypothetical protein [Dongiaceae bacterium]
PFKSHGAGIIKSHDAANSGEESTASACKISNFLQPLKSRDAANSGEESTASACKISNFLQPLKSRAAANSGEVD